MTTRCDEYKCEAASVDGLVQQVAVSYLRHGYLEYVADVLKPHVDPLWFDELILTKYNIRKCWRYRAEQKARGLANLQYIRHGRFYIIMATDGNHEFKVRERNKLRDVRESPLIVPLETKPEWFGKSKKEKLRFEDPRLEECYCISYSRGRYERKSAEERAAYREAWARWKLERERGKRLPKPARGKVKVTWHPSVSIEEVSFERMRAFFMTYATKWKRDKLEIEFRSTPYKPYWGVKRQLFKLLCEVSDVRKTAGMEVLRYRCVHGLKRDQIHPFGEAEVVEARRDVA